MTARMLALDLRRGPAPIVALAVLVLGGAQALSAADACDGRWSGALFALRQDAMWLAFPCVLAAGVWRGGRARRRQLDDALGAASLPAWRRAAVEGGSIGVAGLAAVVVLLGAVIATGGCTSGPGSWAAAGSGVVTVLSLFAAAFVGLALGRVATGPMVTPLVLFLALAVTSVFGGWTAEDGRAMLLLPAVGEEAAADDLTGRISVAQMLWFAGLGLAGWLAASQRLLAGLAVGVAGLVALLALA